MVAGAHNSAGAPEISGSIQRVFTTSQAEATGAFSFSDAWTGAQSGGGSAINALNFSASDSNDIYSNSTTIMPDSVNQPIMIYLGRPA